MAHCSYTACSTATRQNSKHNVVNVKQTVETRSAKAKKPPNSSSSNNPRDQAPLHDSVSAAGNGKPTQLSTDDISCAHCNDIINGDRLRCDICDNTYHGHCTALPHDVISVLLTIASQCGWVCEPCRSACRGKLLRMSAAQTKAAEEVACLTTTVTEMRNEMQKLETKINSVVLNNNNNNTAVNETETLTTENLSAGGSVSKHSFAVSLSVHKTLHDLNRRQRNVVVTGIPESDDASFDKTVFEKFCEDNLTIKPAVRNCRRLGKIDVSRTKPRLLLVELSTPDNAKELRRSATRLRYSNDESARSVYINADLSPAEAKLSYEQRERRRRRTIQTAGSIASTTDSQTTTLSETATHSSNCDMQTRPDSISTMDTVPSTKSDGSTTDGAALCLSSYVETTTGTDSNFRP